MRALRRILYAAALVYAVGGLAAALVPGLVVETILGQPAPADDAWIRLLGAQGVVLALLAVPIAHRVEDHWWWSWAFALGSAAWGLIASLHLILGLPRGASPHGWWVLAGLGWGLALAIAWGMTRAAQEKPPGL